MFPLKDNIPTERLPVVTLALIALNVVVYFFVQQGGWEISSLTSGAWSLGGEAAYPCDLTGQCPAGEPPAGHIGPWASVFTAMFMHGGLLHLGGNMLFLWIFGNNVEDAMGRATFLLFYLGGGLAAMGLQTLIDPSAAVPTVGASGAIAAVLGAYLLLYPRARVVTLILIVFFFTLIEVPAALVLAGWFVIQVVFGALDYTSAGDGGGIAYFAHVGGFLFGLAVVRLLAKPRETAPVPYRV